MPELWWHYYAGVCDHGSILHTCLGESPEHPEALVAAGKATYTSPMVGCDCTVTMYYVRSWNREPTETETDDAVDRLVERLTR